MQHTKQLGDNDLIHQQLLCIDKLNQDLRISEEEIVRLKAVIADVKDVNRSWQRHNTETQRYIRKLEAALCRLHCQLDPTPPSVSSSTCLQCGESSGGFDSPLELQLQRLRAELVTLTEHNRSLTQRHFSTNQTNHYLHTKLQHALHKLESNMLSKTKPEVPHEHNMEKDLKELFCHRNFLEMDRDFGLIGCDAEERGEWCSPEQVAACLSVQLPPHLSADLSPCPPHSSSKTKPTPSDDITCPVCSMAFPPDSNLIFLKHTQLCIKSSNKDEQVHC